MKEKDMNFSFEPSGSKENINEEIIKRISDSDVDAYAFISMKSSSDGSKREDDIAFIPWGEDVKDLMALYFHFRMCFYKFILDYVPKNGLIEILDRTRKFAEDLIKGDD